MGLAIGRRLKSRGLLGLGIAVNLLALALFKYGAFLAGNVEAVMQTVGLIKDATIQWDRVFPPLPIGISFYTFQAISYLIDIRRGQCVAQADPVKFGMYLAMFPQLIAGPIVRFAEIDAQIVKRDLNLNSVHAGMRRFVSGLAMKVLIADPLALAVDAVFGAPISDVPGSLAWLALGGYALQIYFDFSGYSSMAIGIGRMLGFHFPENFDAPYTARNVREFWRRWHMTLSRWFRDYLYVPLGGNRGTERRVAFNLLAVFLLCGLWHGASWNFIIWGIYHGGFLALERTRWGEWLGSAPRLLGHVYTLLVVLFGWVLFRCESLEMAAAFFARLVGMLPDSETPLSLVLVAGRGTFIAFAVGAVWALLPQSLRRTWLVIRVPGWVQTVGVLLILAACLLVVASDTYSPFLYFRF